MSMMRILGARPLCVFKACQEPRTEPASCTKRAEIQRMRTAETTFRPMCSFNRSTISCLPCWNSSFSGPLSSMQINRPSLFKRNFRVRFSTAVPKTSRQASRTSTSSIRAFMRCTLRKCWITSDKGRELFSARSMSAELRIGALFLMSSGMWASWRRLRERADEV